MNARTTAHYDQTASRYDDVILAPEHDRALAIVAPLLRDQNPTSILDIGCGTGRALAWCAAQFPKTTIAGIDPSQGMLELAKGRVPGARLQVGRGEDLPFLDGAYDVTIATGILHHVDNPKRVVSEMFRVASKAVVISDHNNFAFGGDMAKRVRMTLYCLGILDLFTFVKQGFRRQGYSAEDGWWYPYSLMNDFDIISSSCAQYFVFPTRPLGRSCSGNFLLGQSHFGVLAMK